jgi:hypothetical protein|nr:MAG TPA: hypothetical protein [Caudoviricetes sp.]
MAVTANKKEVVKEEGAFVTYSTVRPCNVLFNILCKGEIIYGRFADHRTAVRFDVPKHLVSVFDKHHHVRKGFIVPLSKLPKNLQ